MGDFDLQTSRLRCHFLKGFEVLMTLLRTTQLLWERIIVCRLSEDVNRSKGAEWTLFWYRGSSYQNDRSMGSIQEWAGEKLSNKTLPDEDWTRAREFILSKYGEDKTRLPRGLDSGERSERICTFCLRLTILLDRQTQPGWRKMHYEYEYEYVWMRVMYMLTKQTRDIS